MAQILVDQDDLNSVRGYLGLSPLDFTDPTIESLFFLPAAELVIRKIVNKASVDTGGLVPTVNQIMNDPDPIPPATEDDKLALRLAVAAYISYQFTPGSTNAVNVSVTKKVGPIEKTEDRGGLGTQWTRQMEIAFEQVGLYLAMITGWPEPTQTLFSLSGPTSSGVVANTFSGFFII